MEDIIIRQATKTDIPFLVKTIVEAEKSGTEILSYSKVFGISEYEAMKYISAMLLEEVDNCEISINSFTVAETNGQVAAALSAWIEGKGDVPSAELKGNLLNYTLPYKSIQNAASVHEIVRGVHIDYIPRTIQKGAMYVDKRFRGRHFIDMLMEYSIKQILKTDPDITQVYTQVFDCNIPAVKVYERNGFRIVETKESGDNRILNYLPSKKKLVMYKNVNSN